MRFVQALRAYVQRQLLIAKMKAERVQARLFPSFDVPMTVERIQDRSAHLPKGWKLVLAPVAIRYHHKFASFKQCTEFVNGQVADLAAQEGYQPTVEIQGSELFLTLGIDAPPILSEGDFDFAEQIVEPEPAPEPENTGVVPPIHKDKAD